MKKALSSILAMAMIFTMIQIGIISASAYQRGGYTYSVSNSAAHITKYTGTGTDITVPSTLGGYPVKGIEYNAFENCTSLTSVTIPDCVESISSEVFIGCTSLQTVNVGTGVNSFSNHETFDGCSSLTAINVAAGNTHYSSIDGVLFNAAQTELIRYPLAKTGSYTIPNSVLNIVGKAFDHCTGITEVTTPLGLTAIGNEAFCNCMQLTTVIFTGPVSIIDVNAFVNCSALSNISIPDSVTTIGENAFCLCTSLTVINISQYVTTIGEGAFAGCSSLTAINVNANNPNYSSIDGVLFNKAGTILICYPGGKTVGTYTIPSSVNTVSNYAFALNSLLEEVDIYQTISFGENPFYHCGLLATIYLGSGVSSFSKYVIATAQSLTAINVHSNNPNYSSVAGVLFNKAGTVLVAYPNAKPGNYIIPDNVEGIADIAFLYCTGLTGLTLSDDLTANGIGFGAVAICSNLEYIDAGSNLNYYTDQNGVLFNSTRTKLVLYPGGKQGSYIVPSTVTDISAAFVGCVKLTGITFANGSALTNIGSNAFDSCTGLTDIVIPSSVTQIGNSAFAGCTGLTDIVIPNNVTQIGESAFTECTGLTGVDIPDSVTAIGDNAFEGCTSLTGAYFLGDAPTMGNSVFEACGSPFKVYYHSGSTGFSLYWYGYTTEVF